MLSFVFGFQFLQASFNCSYYGVSKFHFILATLHTATVVEHSKQADLALVWFSRKKKKKFICPTELSTFCFLALAVVFIQSILYMRCVHRVSLVDCYDVLVSFVLFGTSSIHMRAYVLAAGQRFNSCGPY